jgi:TM2 domain-containing membrane protein YozV
MNCYLHPDAQAIAYCRTCGRALCGACQRPAEGTVFCEEHLPVAAYPNPADPYAQGAASAASSSSATANPYDHPAAGFSPVAPVQTSPGLAFLLGWIPGVGAIYNGQYVKGLVHALIFGLLISLISSAENSPGVPLLAMVLVGFVFYMPFEAYHTAKKRQMGIRVDEWSSLLSQSRYTGRAPVGPVVLILIGVVFLLDSLHLVEFREIGRFWPVILIVVGAYMLYSRVSGRPDVPPASRPSGLPGGSRRNGVMEAPNEQ